MSELDFRNLDEPLTYFKKNFNQATEAEIMEMHLAVCELLNMLWDIHSEGLASNKLCDKLVRGEGNY